MPLRLEVVPDKAVVVRRDKSTVAASWFGPAVLRPYIYPFLGPLDRELTRLGHPLDPVGHSHHKSVWIGHHDVSGVSFWEDSPESGRIEQTDLNLGTAEGNEVSFTLECAWKNPAGNLLLKEARKLTFQDLGGELALEIDTLLKPAEKEKPVVLGDTPFGLLGIRVARTIRVAEGLGGLILNSQDAENEAGCHSQHADWCDYSGPVPWEGPPRDPGQKEGDLKKQPDSATLPAVIVGIACFNHHENSPTDTLWHVRDDGWMGPSISKGEPRTIPAAGLRARYRIEAHRGRPWEAEIGEKYRKWRRK
jgi:hypothetical protein